MRNKKVLYRMVTLALSMLLLAANAVIGSANTSVRSEKRYSFYFELEAYGDKSQSDQAIKENTADEASIMTDVCRGGRTWVRLRSGTNSTQASALYEIDRFEICPQYYSGYGLQNYPYYFRIQTDSSSVTGATLSGAWIP